MYHGSCFMTEMCSPPPPLNMFQQSKKPYHVQLACVCLSAKEAKTHVSALWHSAPPPPRLEVTMLIYGTASRFPQLV